MLTVLTWFWAQPGGRATYRAEHVNTWAAMVRRHLSLPHRLAVVTDTPAGIDPSIAVIAPPRDFEGVTIPTWGPDKPQCLRRLAMFRRDAAATFGERFVCMDLDVVIAGPLDPLFDVPVAFKMFRGSAPARPYNGSMMLLSAGARPQVYERFTPEGATAAGRRFIGSDQAWISHILGPGEATWGPEQGCYFWRGKTWGAAAPARLVFFPGEAKPWDVVDRGLDPFVAEHYRDDAPGSRALILGYGPGLWADLEAALATGPFAAVIASPEAARHWPGQVTAVARDDDHALRLARRLGFDSITFCGRSEKAAA